jgi:hypothetical protein
MNIGEAVLMNNLLSYLLGPDGGLITIDGGKAREAAAELANRAHKQLSAGIDGDRVRKLWTDAAPMPRRRPMKPKKGKR